MRVKLLSHGIIINSIRGGRTSAKIVLQTAPIRDNKRSSCGINTATAKVQSTMKLLKISSPANGYFLASTIELLTDGYMI